jgi:nicotinamide-nucleotide amidase
MRVAIVTIGSELLDGRVADTNAQWIGGELHRRGIEAVMAVTVDDAAGSIADALDIARERAEVVWVTGGMGATRDDLTTEVVARFLGRELVEDAGAADRIRKICLRRGIEATGAQLRQARIPRGARPLENPEGMAAGFMEDTGETLWIVLPGVPAEMKAMASASVLPDLSRRSGVFSASVDLNLAGIPESVADGKIRDLWDGLGEGEVFALQAGSGEVRLRITVRGAAAAEAQKRLAHLEGQVRERVGAFVCGTGDEGLAQSIIAIMRGEGATLATVESLTGGMVSSRLASVAGASEVLRGGWVAYTGEFKEKMVGVARATLDKFGAVSRETALELARGAREKSGADYAVSTTGWAGPGGGTDADPVGTVYVGVASESGASVERFYFRGGRETVRAFAAAAALVMLRRVVSGGGE